MTANHQPTELERLRAAYLALARHLAAAHDDTGGGNGGQLHARHRAHHGLDCSPRHPHSLPPHDEQETP